MTTALSAVPDDPNLRKITYSHVEVTSAIAQRWLDNNNTHNRRISKARVIDYARKMTDGRWKFNGETIQFDWNGVLRNGQHRLLAIVESGLAQQVLIVRGLDPMTQITMDQGTRRTPAEQMEVMGILADNTTTAAVRVYIQWRTGRLFGDQIRNKVQTEEVVEWAMTSRESLEQLRDLSTAGVRRIYSSPSIVLAVALRLHEIDDFEAGQFFAGLMRGADLYDGSPILALRNRLDKDAKSRVRNSIRDVIGMFVMAWNAYREGRTIAKIQRPIGGKWTVENFPEPK